LKRRLSTFKVARPLVRLQQLQRVLADATDTLARPLGKPMSEVLHEEGDIQAALAQRRQLQLAPSGTRRWVVRLCDGGEVPRLRARATPSSAGSLSEPLVGILGHHRENGRAPVFGEFRRSLLFILTRHFAGGGAAPGAERR
jgi:hypothetical protein